MTLNVGLGRQQPPPSHQPRNGPSRQRRCERRVDARNVAPAEEATAKENELASVNAVEDAAEVTSNGTCGTSENISKQVAENATIAKDVVNLKNEILDLKTINNDIKAKLKLIEEENEDLKQTIVVKNMIHDGLRDKMKDRFGYDSDEEAEEYYQEQLRKDQLTCEMCDFFGRTEAGLRQLVTMKHKTKCSKGDLRIGNEELKEHTC